VEPTIFTSNPCTASLSGTCTSYGPTSDLDMWGRAVYSAQSNSNATDTITFTQNDVLNAFGPAPSFDGENTKQVQTEYNGLGQRTKVCHIGTTTSTGSGTACSQNTGSASGATDAYTYSYSTGQVEISIRRGGSGGQTRSVYKDGLGRAFDVVTPEGGTFTYFWDHSTSACGPSYGGNGRLEATEDPNGNLICYAYDAMNRVTQEWANGTTCRWFYYDNSSGYTGTIPTGISLSNQYGRLVEAATDACAATKSSATLITDEWFNYDKDGNVLTMWEETPNSTQYYKSVATFYGNRAIDTIQLASPSEYTITYGLDGEGRWNSMTDSHGSNNDRADKRRHFQRG
jgi:hypothetical protein